MISKLIFNFNQKILDERLNSNSTQRDSILLDYQKIINGMASDYSEYRKNIVEFLNSLESNNPNSISYSVSCFFSLFNLVKKLDKFKNFDISRYNQPYDEETIYTMSKIFDSKMNKSSIFRLSEENFDISHLTDIENLALTSFIIDNIQHESKNLNWDVETVKFSMLQLSLLRQLLSLNSNRDVFYYTFSLFFDRMVTSENFQAARDIAEEIIITSNNDDLLELGYFSSFRLYSNLSSVNAAFIYLNISLTCLLKKEPPYSERFVKDLISQSIKFFRNVRLYPWGIEIYKSIPKSLTYGHFEKRSIDHTYFTILLKIRDSTLPSLILDYLNKEREIIISGGVHDVLPWLITLYNLRNLYTTSPFISDGLNFYINIFEYIVPVESVKKFKDIITADSQDLKRHLKDSLIKLNETRNVTDFVYDNELAIGISNSLIIYSFKHNDPSSFILAMLLKSDFTILFIPKETTFIASLKLPEVDIDNLESLYENKPEFLDLIPLDSEISMIWLAFIKNDLYELHLFKGDYIFASCSSALNGIINTDFFIDMCFSDTKKDKSGVRETSLEEYEDEEKTVLQKLSTAKLSFTKDSKGLYVVKDMNLSSFPHNLFINEDEDFIFKYKPITNVLSTEWLIKTIDFESLNSNYTKSIWIPTDSGDFQLNWLYSGIEETLIKNSFEIYKTTQLLSPLSADINILCSHGAKNISDVQIVFQNDIPNYELSSLIGKGKILIFFVCYSGSQKSDFFRNDIKSLVMRFIAEGYQAVIAPFWALDVTIPQLWLPEFLNSLNSNLDISEAMFNANNEVYKKYPTPAAWACLHLYGNPNLKIVKDH